MNNRTKRWAPTLLIIIAAGLLPVLASCDKNSASNPVSGSSTSTMSVDPTKLAGDLNLTSEQTAQMQGIFAKHVDGGPANLWAIAAELQGALSDEAKQKLIDMGEQPPMGPDSLCPMPGMRGPGPGPNPLDSLLSAEQKHQIDSIRDSYRDRMDALRDQRIAGTISAEEFQSGMQSLMESMKSDIDGILTAEQKAALEELRQQHHGMRGGPEHHGGRRGGPGGPGGPGGQAGPQHEQMDPKAQLDSMASTLGLSDAQKTAIVALMESQRTAHQELMDKVRNGEVTPEEARSEFEALRQARDAELAKILDATQLEIVKIHDALMRRMGPPPHGRRG